MCRCVPATYPSLSVTWSMLARRLQKLTHLCLAGGRSSSVWLAVCSSSSLSCWYSSSSGRVRTTSGCIVVCRVSSTHWRVASDTNANKVTSITGLTSPLLWHQRPMRLMKPWDQATPSPFTCQKIKLHYTNKETPETVQMFFRAIGS